MTIKDLELLEPCPPALKWVRSQPNVETTLQTAWERCERTDWMLWYLSKKGVKKEVFVELANNFVEHVGRLKNKAANAAYAAYATANANAYATAAYAADDADDAADAAAYDSYDAYNANAYNAATAYNAANAAYTAALKSERQWQCDQIRLLFPLVDLATPTSGSAAVA